MKKLAIVLAMILFAGTALQAQYVFNKGDIGINAGIGVFGYDGLIPSIEGSVEFGVIPTGDVGLVSFGGMAGYKYSTYGYTGYYDYNYSKFQFGARGAWHLQTFKSSEWDVYAGIGAGMSSRAKWDAGKVDYVTTFNPYTELFVGGRMMFDSGFGLFAEVGYSHISSARFGLTFLM